MAKGFGRPSMGGMGGAGGGGINMNMLKQAQKMQQDMQRMQEEMEAKEYTAQAGGGVVRATVTGKRELLRLTIDPEVVDPEDVELLQDMIVAAINEANRAAEGEMSASMQQITGGMGMPF